ncbi:MAG: glucose 1-dehydrogenase [bacterium]|nr:glucose 1-dehydrogenase [bacterium]
MTNPERHAGKVAAVTGGASGIGRGCVERLAGEGASVLVLDVADATGVVEACRELPGRVQAVPCDVTDEDQVGRGVAKAVELFGGLDIMVNNAGTIFVAPIVDSEAAEWRRLMDVNVIGVYLGMRAAARQMIASGRGGVIINASSGAGRHGVPNFAHYCASKAAVIMMTQSAAVELGPHCIRVNSYTPGHIMTPFWEEIAGGYARVAGMTPDQAIEAFGSTIPWGRFGTPADVAATVSFLATEDAEYISGQAIGINGAELPW